MIAAKKSPLSRRRSALCSIRSAPCSRSIPKDRIPDLLNETFKALNGTADNLSVLSDSASRLAADFNSTAEQSRTLIEDSRPLLDGQPRVHRLHPDMGPQPGRHHRSAQHERSAVAAPPARELARGGRRGLALANQVKPTLKPVLLG